LLCPREIQSEYSIPEVLPCLFRQAEREETLFSRPFAATFLDWTAKAHPTALDLHFFSFDASLHAQFFLALRFSAHVFWLSPTLP
jgi:hypothetical protein